MLRMRLRRVGAKKQPSYRIVVAEITAPRDGKFVEVVGFFNPRTEPETIQFKSERALYWLTVGAQPTDAVARLLKKKGILDLVPRVHAGESIEDLVAGLSGQEPVAVVEEVVEGVVEAAEEAEAEAEEPAEEEAAE